MLSTIFLLLLVFLPLLYVCSSKFRYIACMVTLYFLILTTTVIALIPVCCRPYDIRNHRWVFNIFQWLTRRWSCITWEVRGKQILDEFDGPCVLLANHQSSVDLLAMPYVWPVRGAVMAKRSLKYAGLFGVSATLSGCVFIDRFNGAKARNTLDETEKRIVKQNMMLWVFPEGTRNHERGMLPFKKGAFHIAINCQIPIIPIVISDYSPFYSKSEMRVGRGHGIIEVLEPIPTDGMSKQDLDKLMDRTREMMIKTYEKISPEAADICRRVQYVDEY